MGALEYWSAAPVALNCRRGGQSAMTTANSGRLRRFITEFATLLQEAGDEPRILEGGGALLLPAFHGEPGLAKALNQGNVFWLVKKFANALRHAGADVVHLLQFFLAGVPKGIHRTEVLREKLRRALANHGNTEPVDYALEGQLLGAFDLL